MKTQVEIRDALVAALRYDTIGPMEPREILPVRPSRWYLTGFLVPRGGPAGFNIDPTALEELNAPTTTDPGEAPSPDEAIGDDEQDAKTSASRPFLPSSMGLSFLVGPEVEAVEVRGSWGRYQQLSEEETLSAMPEELRLAREARAADRGEEEGTRQRYWARQGDITRQLKVPIRPGLTRLTLAPDITLTVLVRPVPEGLKIPRGARSVALFLVNEARGQTTAEAEQYTLFQARLEVACAEGFCPRAPQGHSEDADERRNDLQFRDHLEWAVGHGVSTRVVDPQEEVVRGIATTWLPQARVYRMAPGGVPGVELGMEALAALPNAGALKTAMAPLLTQYGAWIESERGRIPLLRQPARQETATELMDEAAAALGRIEAGIDYLAADPDALKAFRLANRAMAMAARQQRDYGDDDGPRWRLFQLAFVLLNLQGVGDPDHEDRRRVELLFFPTGGGKTEAYLGVAAYAIALRRLRGRGTAHGGAGVSVLLRYTLRLLTLDQLGRATTLMCALEHLRLSGEEGLGEAPITAGLWVGSKATPNTLVAAREMLSLHRKRGGDRFAPPVPLVGCPWCGAAFTPESFVIPGTAKAPGPMRVYCAALECAFSAGPMAISERGLPVVVVDEQVYRELPTLLIATVDKFALLPWKGEAGALFGRVLAADDTGYYGWGAPKVPKQARALKGGLLPPGLVIQDELHLINGPLGTMVGLYEAAIERLSEDAQGRGPKILASTATVRQARAQIRALYARPDVAMFPPQGLEVGDTFFAQTDTREETSRLYVGLAAPGRSAKRILTRVSAALTASAYGHWLGDAAPGSKAPASKDNPADTYMTQVTYFNSLRELGGAKRLMSEEVAPQVSRMEDRRPVGAEGSAHFRNRFLSFDVMELTSREDTGRIRATKGRLEAHFESKEGGRNDLLFASSMISVGVDIDRLGLMVVHGQPRTTAEYIQASSRVGRRTPGLVVTILNTYRPRDRSHYERFTAYHEAFYRRVEASSVTPFSLRALERGLAGLTVALARHTRKGMTSAGAVTQVRGAEGLAEEVAAYLRKRAEAHREGDNAELGALVEERTRVLFYEWGQIVRRLSEQSRPMRYSPFERHASGEPLLSTAVEGEARLTEGLERFRAPTSMRDVEPSVHLWLNWRKREANR